jgi:hypothetical protein
MLRVCPQSELHPVFPVTVQIRARYGILGL